MTEIPRPSIKDRMQERAERVFFSNVPSRAQEIMDSPDFFPPTKLRIEEYRQNVDKGPFSDTEKDLLHRCLDLAIVAHQDNAFEHKRFRRKIGTHDNREYHLPFIHHPLSAGLAMTSEKREVPLLHPDSEQGEKPITLTAKQGVYDATTNAAMVLHDVMEDVRLDLVPGTDIAVQGEAEWTGFIKRYLASYGHVGDSIEDIVTVVKAVTKYKEIPADVWNAVSESQLHGMMAISMSLKDATVPFAKVEEQTLMTVADLHKILITCYGKNGKRDFNARNHKNFFRAIAVKNFDLANNLEDGEVRYDKLVRAFQLAQFARLLGFPIASVNAAQIAVNAQFDSFWGNQEDYLHEAYKLVEFYNRFEQQERKPTFFIDNEAVEVNAFQIPLFTPDEIAETDGFRPTLQYRMIVRNSWFLDHLEEVYRSTDEGEVLQISFRDNEYVGVPICTETQLRILETGRRCFYFNVYRAKEGQKDPTKPQLIGIYRIQDAKPSAHSVIQADSKTNAFQVPERRLIESTFDGSAESSIEIFSLICPAE